MEKKQDTKRKKIVYTVIVVAILIVIADLILFLTSINSTGVGQGFSRFWNK
jgi:uncharacterized integral membrane protein